MTAELFIGIDVQLRRPCALAILDDRAEMIFSTWFRANEVSRVKREIREVRNGKEIAIGIDSPRTPLKTSREWYWVGRARRWRKRTKADRGHGRHCEVVVKSLGLANPQWTPPRNAAPPWMCLGFDLFDGLDDIGDVFEIFPTASYASLESHRGVTATIDLSTFTIGPTHMIDAVVGAVTVREFVEGRGTEVGGGDGLGTIILPKPVEDHPVLQWPAREAGHVAT